MTPKEIEDIRSWRRGEWVADITEIESMVYGLVDEIDRLRAAADGLEHYVTTRRDDMRDSLKSGLLEGPERWCAAREGATLTETLDRGRELGLWS